MLPPKEKEVEVEDMLFFVDEKEVKSDEIERMEQ